MQQISTQIKIEKDTHSDLQASNVTRVVIHGTEGDVTDRAIHVQRLQGRVRGAGGGGPAGTDDVSLGTGDLDEDIRLDERDTPFYCVYGGKKKPMWIFFF